MATVSTQVRIDETTKKQAMELLEGLGLSLSDAVNMFLKQVVLHDGIPFDVKYPKVNYPLSKANGLPASSTSQPTISTGVNSGSPCPI